MNTEKLTRCAYCDAIIPDIATYCPHCRKLIRKSFERIKIMQVTDYEQATNSKQYFENAPYTGRNICMNSSCGKEIHFGEKHCMHCGMRFEDKQAEDLSEEKKLEKLRAKQIRQAERNAKYKFSAVQSIAIAVLVGFVLFEGTKFPVFQNKIDELNSLPIFHMRENDIPLDSVVVSSTNDMTEGENSIFHPMYLCDNDLDTAWCEGTDDVGIGEQITLQFTDTYVVKKLELYSGYMQSEDLLRESSQIHEMTLTFSDGSEQKISLERCDTLDKAATVKFKDPIETSSITMTINSVYEGGSNRNTCISEIRVKGEGDTVQLPKLVHRKDAEESSAVELTDEIGTIADAYFLPKRTLVWQKDAEMTGDDVKFVQATLFEMGFSDISVNGKYDEQTKNAVKSYQESLGITQTGVVTRNSAVQMQNKLSEWRELHQNDEGRIVVDDYTTIIDASQYKKFIGTRDRFSFSYPESFYEHMEYVHDDMSEIVKFWTDHSGSSALFSYEERTDQQELLDKYWDLYWTCSDSLYDVEEILSAEEASDGGARFILTGYQDSGRSEEVYELVYVTDTCVREMRIVFPSIADNGASNEKWYYVESMYRMCGFSNSSKTARTFENYLNGLE